MSRSGTWPLCIALALLPLLSPAARAEEKDAEPNRFEVTLFGGYRFGGSLQDVTTVSAGNGTVTQTTSDVHLDEGMSYGIAFNWPYEPDSAYELIYSRQSTTLKADIPLDVTVEYLQFGGYVMFGSPTRFAVPYFLLTVGAARFTPDSSDLESATKAAAAIGGGVKFPLAKNFALRLDGRLNASFFEHQQDVFCRSGAGLTCRVHLRGGSVLQPELSVGFTTGF